MSLQERLRERKKATKWARGVDLDYATEWEPDQLCLEAAAELDRLQARVAELEGAMQDILRVHADDNIRPRAFYIAADAIDTARKAKP